MSVRNGLLGKPLSPTERQILGAIAEGASDAQMSRRLVMAESTVKTHVRSILPKLGARNRANAVKLGYQSGYLRLDVNALARKPIGRAA